MTERQHQRVLLGPSRGEVFSFSHELFTKDCPNGWSFENNTTIYKYSVVENILSGQSGLSLSNEEAAQIAGIKGFKLQFKTPMWVDDQLLHIDGGLLVVGYPLDVLQNIHGIKHSISSESIALIRRGTNRYTAESQFRISKLIKDLGPDIIKLSNAYEFEEVVAELLRDRGVDTYLTPRSNDGGKDIIACSLDQGQPHVCIIECKKRDSRGYLEPKDVRALVGVLALEKKKTNTSTVAMMVTSADKIGRSSNEFHEILTDFSIIDRERLLSWINEYGRIHDNYWIPETILSYFK